MATGGYGTVFYLATYAKGCNASAIWRAYKKGAAFANPCYTQIHPTCIPVTGDHQSKLTLMSESLRNDGRIWVPSQEGRQPPARPDPRGRARLLPRAEVPELRQPLPPRHLLPGRQGGLRRGPGRRPDRAWASTSTSPTRSSGSGAPVIKERYGNLFEMYERITDDDPYKVPMRIYPAIHYAMGGLWVDYNLMSTIPGLFVCGEANFSDHGANRLGASALMQGWPTATSSSPTRWATTSPRPSPARSRPTTRLPRGRGRRQRPAQAVPRDPRPADRGHLPPRAGQDHLGPLRDGPERGGAAGGALEKIPALRQEFWEDVCVLGEDGEVNQSLEKAGRVADFLELASCCASTPWNAASRAAAHFRRSSRPRTARPSGRRRLLPRRRLGIRRRGEAPIRNVEPLEFENIQLQTRSYK